jgi:hypothetical protein
MFRHRNKGVWNPSAETCRLKMVMNYIILSVFDGIY